MRVLSLGLISQAAQAQELNEIVLHDAGRTPLSKVVQDGNGNYLVYGTRLENRAGYAKVDIQIDTADRGRFTENKVYVLAVQQILQTGEVLQPTNVACIAPGDSLSLDQPIDWIVPGKSYYFQLALIEDRGQIVRDGRLGRRLRHIKPCDKENVDKLMRKMTSKNHPQVQRLDAVIANGVIDSRRALVLDRLPNGPQNGLPLLREDVLRRRVRSRIRRHISNLD